MVEITAQTFAGLGPLLGAIGIGVVRSFGGWLENAAEDKKFSAFEYGQLGGTIIRVTLMTGALYFGIEGIFGTDISVLAAGAGAFITDFIVKKLSSRRIPAAPSKK